MNSSKSFLTEKVPTSASINNFFSTKNKKKTLPKILSLTPNITPFGKFSGRDDSEKEENLEKKSKGNSKKIKSFAQALIEKNSFVKKKRNLSSGSKKENLDLTRLEKVIKIPFKRKYKKKNSSASKLNGKSSEKENLDISPLEIVEKRVKGMKSGFLKPICVKGRRHILRNRIERENLNKYKNNGYLFKKKINDKK